MLEVVDLLTPVPLPTVQDYLVYPWLMPGRLTLMVGPTEIGKTTLTLDMIAALAKGGHLWDRYPAKPIRKVLYLHAEHSLHTLQEMATQRKDLPTDLILAVHDFGADGPSLLVNGEPNKPLLTNLCHIVDKVKPDLLIAEPISAFISTDENNNREARAVVRILSSLGERSNAAILTHHHVGKSHFDPEHSRASGIPVGEARGAQAFEDAAEKVIYLKRKMIPRAQQDQDTQAQKWHLVLETPKPKGFPVDPVTLSFDEDMLTYKIVAQPLGGRDLIGVYSRRRSNSEESLTDTVEYLRLLWHCSNLKVWHLVRRCQRMGLLDEKGNPCSL